jgi:hypothetical protein
MPLEHQPSRPWPPPLAGRLAGDADARQLSEAIAAVWHEIDVALHPVIGHRGVAALYMRSLRQCMPAHPWLVGACRDSMGDMDLLVLKSAVAQQTAGEAAAAGPALFDAFRSLLASLVGTALTDRLLLPVWASPSGKPPAQDNTP